MKLKRFLSMALVVVLVLSTVATVSAENSDYGAMEFVVTTNKVSVATGDTVTITITGNGRMNNLSAIQYQIVFDPDEFSTGKNTKKAFDTEYYETVSLGSGIGAIATPEFAQQDSVGGMKTGTVVIMDSARSGETDDGDKYMLFISEGCDLYGKTTATFGKIVFTALTDIEDISDCFTLQNAKTAYGNEGGSLASNIFGDVVQLSETIAIQNKAEAAKVEELITAIGTVTIDSEEKIIDAEKAWEALTKAQQGYVSNYSVLTKAREDYNNLIANKKLAEDIEKLISLIPAADTITNENAEAVRTLIENARSEYDKATDEARKLVNADVYKLLEDAETALENVDKAEAAKADALILAIGTVTLDGKQAILDARSAYNALSDAQKDYVKNYDVLTKAEKDYDILSGYKKEAEELEKSIKALSELGAIDRLNAETARGKIDSVRVSYDAVDKAIQDFVGKDVYQILLDAEAEIALVEAAIVEAKSVEELIEDIGVITLDSVIASEEKLTEIAGKLESISDRAKGYIYSDMMTAYDEACSTLADCKSKLSRVQAVIDAIDALGAADGITLENKDAIEAAEALYDDLEDSELKNRVENAQTLFAIRTKLNALIASKNKVDYAISCIDAIGEVKLDAESKAKIDLARSSYNVLTNDEKAEVNNYTTLTDAEALYNELYKAAEQEEKDQTAADSVIKLIGDIGTVELTPECEALIIAAENAYKALENDRQRQLVGSHYDILAQARADYDALKADKAAVDAVIKAINDIGPVEYNDECLARIQSAQEAYEGLRKDLRDSITNYENLQSAKDKYAQLEAEDKAVKNVISLIDAIGEVSWTEDSLSKINAARSAYDELKRDDLKAKVENADVLIEAEKIYTSLKPVFKQEQIEAYNGKHMTVVTNVPEDMTVSDGSGADAVLIKLGDTVYHVFVTDHVVSEADIVLKPSTPVVHELGNINGQGGITANDAQMACQYAARTEEAIKVFAEDPLAFVRADVNGNGKITALDALMIANKAAGLKEVEFTLLVGAIQNAQ